MTDSRELPGSREEAAHSEMPAEHALLGLLAMRDGGVGHGYELARSFESGAPLGNVIRLEPGMVYHHLKKLQRLGWVAELPVGTSDRTARRPYGLSAAGKDELRRWLTEPVAHTREIRLEFLVKLYLALALDPTLAVRLIDEQRDQCGRLIEALAGSAPAGQASEGDASGHARFDQMVRDMRLAQTRAAMTWLDRVRQEATALAARTSAESELRS